MSWRQYFCQHLGITAEIETAQPGHTVGCVVFYVILALCFAALVFGGRS